MYGSDAESESGHSPAPTSLARHPRERPITLKRLILLVAVAVLTPVLANAQSWWGGPDPDDHHHRHISGNEMAAAGFAAAALLAGAGYLALRRREKS